MSICRLCLKSKILRKSHIFPAFVTKWLRETSVTGKMRTAIKPNKRVQDAIKIQLFCDDCEALLSKYEKYFSENVFKPVLNTSTPVLTYDYRLLKFAVSLSLRMLIVSMENVLRKMPQHKIAAEEAERRWREFLLHDTNMNDYEHHFFMLRLVLGAPEIKGSNINWYFFRAVDGTTIFDAKHVHVYVKLPGFVFISPISSKKLDGMTETLIRDSGKIEFFKQLPSKKIFNFLLDRSTEVLSASGSISRNQRRKIDLEYHKNQGRVEASYGFQLFLAEERHKKEAISRPILGTPY